MPGFPSRSFFQVALPDRPIPTPTIPATAVKIPNFIMTDEYSQSVVVHGGMSPLFTYAKAKNWGNHIERDPIVKATPTNPKKKNHFCVSLENFSGQAGF